MDRAALPPRPLEAVDLRRMSEALTHPLDLVPRGCRLPTLVPSWVPLLTLYYRLLPSRERKSVIFLTLVAIS
jgi:hypothetical protein